MSFVPHYPGLLEGGVCVTVKVRFTGLDRSGDREPGEYRIMRREVLWVFLVAFYSNVGDMQGMLLRYKKKVNVRGGATITMVKGWPWAIDFGQILFCTETLEDLVSTIC